MNEKKQVANPQALRKINLGILAGGEGIIVNFEAEKVYIMVDHDAKPRKTILA